MVNVAHDVSRELRDAEGKWTRGGALKRMVKEAASTRSGPSREEIQGHVRNVQRGTGRTIAGHRIDRTQRDKYRVGLKKEGGGRDTKLYDTPEHAARAIHEGRHHEAGSAARVAGGARDRGKAARLPQKVGNAALADIQAHTEARKQRELAAKPVAPAEVRAGGLKPGMTVSTTHWQGKSLGQHKVAKVERLSGSSNYKGVRSGSGSIYHTAGTRVHTEDGKHYDVSNNTKFKVHGEAPAGGERPYQHTPESALREMVGRGGNEAAARELTSRIQSAAKARTEAENKATGRGGQTVTSRPMGGVPARTIEQAAKEHQAAREALARLVNSRQPVGPAAIPARRREIARLEEELQKLGARRTRTGGYERPPAPGSPEHAAELQSRDLASLEEQLRGSSYSPKELVRLRGEDVRTQLSLGDDRITIKVPSGSEVSMRADTARHLLGIKKQESRAFPTGTHVSITGGKYSGDDGVVISGGDPLRPGLIQVRRPDGSTILVRESNAANVKMSRQEMIAKQGDYLRKAGKR